VLTVPDGAGTVTVYVCDGSGTLTGTIGDTSTPLGAVDEAIQTQVVPEGITAVTTPTTAQAVAVTYELWVYAEIGKTEADLESEIALALTDYLAAIPIGGTSKTLGGAGFVWTDAIRSAIGGVVGLSNLIDLDLTLPAADVAFTSSKAPVAGTITKTAIHLVAN